MNNKKILLIAFVLLSVVQILIPARMITGRENILQNGKEYKFKTEPIDPVDKMRGKYISLNFEDNWYIVENPDAWKSGEEIFVFLTLNDEGFATVKNISRTKPADSNSDFITAKIEYVEHGSENKVYIKYPFDRYYMEENKAYAAEQIYNANMADSTKKTYALVSISNGETVLKDVMINGISISQMVHPEMKKD